MCDSKPCARVETLFTLGRYQSRLAGSTIMPLVKSPAPFRLQPVPPEKPMDRDLRDGEPKARPYQDCDMKNARLAKRRFHIQFT